MTKEAWEVAADEAGYIASDTRRAFRAGYQAAIEAAIDTVRSDAERWRTQEKRKDDFNRESI